MPSPSQTIGQAGAMTFASSSNEDAQWTDEPLEDAARDELGRTSFVTTVAAQIDLAVARDPSTVFGLVGQWGSGKSSIIRQVTARLAGDWVVAEFTPWSSGDASAMSLEFVTTLADALGVEASGESRAKFARYAGFVSPLLSVIPFAGAGASAAAGELLSSLAVRPPWHRQFEELSQMVAETGLRVLIVIDDVDRLGSDELLNLLRVVRLLGRFRGVHYLIAYDQATVEELLGLSGSAARATSFMEKIVQYPFEVPPISRAAALRLTHSVIARVIAATGSSLDDIGLQREADLAQVLAEMIRTPRTLGRFSSQLLAFAPHVVDAELDVLDYVAMTWLRLEAHGVWSELPRWRSELNTGSRPVGLLKSEKIETREWFKRIAAAQPDANERDIVRILELMFPGISLTEVSGFYQHTRAVADEAYFGRYLLLALPEDDVSDELVASVLDELVANGESPRAPELASVLDGEDDIANLALSRALKHRLDSEASSRALLDFVLERVASRRWDPRGPGSPRTTMSPWLAREIALNIEQGQVSAQEVIEAIGEPESSSIVMQFTHALRNRERAKVIAAGFADYWLEATAQRADGLVGEPQLLGNAIEMVAFAYGPERVGGILDSVISDFASYLRVAESFVRFSRWVGGEITYEMTFARAAFEAVVPNGTRQRYAAEVSEARTGLEYDTDDLLEPRVTDDVLREFTLDSLVEGDSDIPVTN